MQVSVSGKQFVFPRSCACCGAYPLTILRVHGTERNRRARTKGWSWDVPYCVGCKRHIRAYERLRLTGFSLATLLPFAAVLLVAATGQYFLAGFGTVTLLLILSVLYSMLLRQLRSKSDENCRGLERAVIYLGSDGSCHSFEIKSHFYAAEFVRANYRKVVNASPQVMSILRNTRFGDYQVPRRIFGKSERL